MQELTTTQEHTESFSEDALFSHLLALFANAGDDLVEGLAGYLVTEDPTYLPEDSEIKMLIRVLGRDKLLRMILSHLFAPNTSFPKE